MGNKTPRRPRNPGEVPLSVGSSDSPEAANDSLEAAYPNSQIDAINNDPQEYSDQTTTDTTPTLTQEATGSERRNPLKQIRERSKPFNSICCRRQPCKAMHPNHPFASIALLVPKNNFLDGSFSESRSDQSCIPLLQEILKRPFVVSSEVTIAMPLLLSRSSPSPPQSPISLSSSSSSSSSWEPWFVYRDPSYQNQPCLGCQGGGGGGGGGDSSNDDSDSYFRSDDDESNSEVDRRRRRNHRARRNRDSENEAIANALAAAAASAASAAASAEASAYSAKAACESANASSASAAASSDSATAAAASAAIVFAYFSDPFPGATNAFQSMVSLPLTPPSAGNNAPNPIARQSSPPVAPTLVATSDIHAVIPTAAPTNGTTPSHAVTPTISVATQTEIPAQHEATPVLDFVELACSAGFLDPDLFNACYRKAITEINLSRKGDLKRYKRIRDLALYYPEPQFGAPSPIKHSQPTAGALPPSHTEGVNGSSDGGNTIGGDSHHGNNTNSGGGSDHGDDTSSSTRYSAPQSVSCSTLKRGRIEGDDGGQESKRRHNCGSHLESNAIMEDSDRCLERRRDQEGPSSTNDSNGNVDSEWGNEGVMNVMLSPLGPRNLSTALADSGSNVQGTEVVFGATVGLDKIKKEGLEDLITHSLIADDLIADVKVETDDEEIGLSDLDYPSPSTASTSIGPTPDLDGNGSKDEYSTVLMSHSSQTDSSNREYSPSPTKLKRRRSLDSSDTIEEGEMLDTVQVLPQQLNPFMESQEPLCAPAFETASIPAVAPRRSKRIARIVARTQHQQRQQQQQQQSAEKLTGKRHRMCSK
ncbi:hypothetical protein BGX21_007667 [Mortierella sp. AD011]|nr:hypothetical protein BGX20_008129 [Mortierella sp. AD010]KAF9398525.1 hypothetical protein BGX21_007667 [Mortierella sp. AD011]